MVGEVVLQDKSDAHVRSDSQVEGEIANPEMSETFLSDCLEHRIEDVFVGHLSISACLHLLQLGLGIVERETSKRRNQS